MKFTKGNWMNRQGVEFYNMVQVRETRIDGNRLYAYTVPYLSDARAVGGPVMEMYVSAPQFRASAELYPDRSLPLHGE